MSIVPVQLHPKVAMLKEFFIGMKSIHWMTMDFVAGNNNVSMQIDEISLKINRY